VLSGTVVTGADKPSDDYRERFYAGYARALGNSGSPSPEHLANTARQFAGRWGRFLPSDRSVRARDLGCGTGEFLHYLRGCGFTDLGGVDLSAEQIAVARDLGFSGCRVEGALPFLRAQPDASIGLISAMNFFEHLRKEEVLDVLAEIARVLQPGGLLLALTPNGLSPFGGATRYWDFSHELAYTPASWRQLARLFGFARVDFAEFGPIPHSLPGALRSAIWQVIRFGVAAIAYVEVGGPRDPSRVYTADMQVVMRR
jgi:SAM-dependent methyltransferase